MKKSEHLMFSLLQLSVSMKYGGWPGFIIFDDVKVSIDGTTLISDHF